MSSFFVAGTDTNVGKTTAARAMIQALQGQGVQVVGYKTHCLLWRREYLSCRAIRKYI